MATLFWGEQRYGGLGEYEPPLSKLHAKSPFVEERGLGRFLLLLGVIG